jgi:hypothetical protein
MGDSVRSGGAGDVVSGDIPRTIVASLVAGSTDKKPRREELPLEEFFARFAAPAIRESKDGPGVTLGAFDADAWKADPRRVRPANYKPNGQTEDFKPSGWLAEDYCARSSGYLGDCDNSIGPKGNKRCVDNPVTFELARQTLDALGIAYTLHTTHSHTVAWPHLRFVVPFAKDLEGTPAEIAKQYLAIHRYFNGLFAGVLDSRSNPAFFAFLPAVPAAQREAFCSVGIADRPLFDAYSIDPAAAPAAKTPGAKAGDFPAPDQLPPVNLAGWKLDASTKSTITNGAAGNRSDELAHLYGTLYRRGMKAAEIAAVVWQRNHKISDAVRIPKRGFNWLCSDITRTLGKIEQKRLERDTEFFRRFVYVERARRYWDRDERVELEIVVFNDRHMPVFGGNDGPRDYTAHKHWQLHWQDHSGVRVRDLTYWPGQPQLVTFKGAQCLNTWRPATVEYTDGAVTRWLALAERLVPDPVEREHFFNLMAYVVQNPGLKPGHHLVLGGGHGIGKDSLLEPIFYTVGGGIPAKGTQTSADRTNVEQVTSQRLESDFSYHLLSQAVCIQELKEVYVGERRKLANALKLHLACPPDTVTVNLKFAHPFDIPNCHVWFATTNHSDAIALDRGERRWFAIWSYAKPMAPAEAETLWEWYRNGGVQAVAGWLKRRDVSTFHAHAAAPATTWNETLVGAGQSSTDAGFTALIEDRKAPFDCDLVSPDEAARMINRAIADGRPLETLDKRIVPGSVAKALTEYGWVSLGRLDVKRKTGRIRATLFVAPERAAEALKLRDSKGGAEKVLGQWTSRAWTVSTDGADEFEDLTVEDLLA